jgi:hypothetical protein
MYHEIVLIRGCSKYNLARHVSLSGINTDNSMMGASNNNHPYLNCGFGQTSGSAHHESRSLNLEDHASAMFSKSTKTGNGLSEIASQGFRLRRASAPGYLKLMPDPPGNKQQRLTDTSSPKSALKTDKRTAGRLCCNRHDQKAMGCRNGSRI